MYFPARRRAHQRHNPVRSRRLCTIIFLIMCMGSLISPLTHSATANQQLARSCAPLEHWDNTLGKCVLNDLQLSDVQVAERTPTLPLDGPVIDIDGPEEETPAPTEVPNIQATIDVIDPTPSMIPFNPDLDLIETPEAGGSGSVTINKHRCPSAFDASAASYNELAANCTESPNGILFGDQ